MEATSRADGDCGAADRRGAQVEAQIIERAYAAHHGAVYGHLVMLTRDPAAAEDLVQEAFLRLTREVQEGRTPDNVGGWLHRVAANLATSRSRRAQVADRWSAALVRHDVETSPEDEIIRRERTGSLRTALAALNEDDRTAVLMAAQGYRGPEIAHRMDRSQAATRTLLCRARGKLRGRLVLADMRP